MNRSRSVSRRPASRRREESVSPPRSRSRSSSVSSHRAPSVHERSRSRSRVSTEHRRHGHAGTLSKSAGVLAGIGIAALVAHKYWQKSHNDHKDERASHSGHASREHASREYVSRGRETERRGTRWIGPAHASDGYSGHTRHPVQSQQSSGYQREPRYGGNDGRQWGGDSREATYLGSSPEYANTGHGRRHN